ncbi:MAG: NADP-dependent oxidoreductase, partial [Gammaproteobacteria bacterium]|nr:NADP-dependent oxidoreductase [Gammaproteobacteria bacterium]
MKSSQVVLQSRPVGLPKVEDFTVREAELPEPGPGEVLVENLCMSVD